MKAELYTEETPGTVANFVELANHNFYDGLTFHRVIPGFVIQGGCPRGDGTGGPGYKIKCETSAPRQYHDRGVLSMAHAGKDTGGSQFFICCARESTQLLQLVPHHGRLLAAAADDPGGHGRRLGGAPRPLRGFELAVRIHHASGRYTLDELAGLLCFQLALHAVAHVEGGGSRRL